MSAFENTTALTLDALLEEIAAAQMISADLFVPINFGTFDPDDAVDEGNEDNEGDEGNKGDEGEIRGD